MKTISELLSTLFWVSVSYGIWQCKVLSKVLIFVSCETSVLMCLFCLVFLGIGQESLICCLLSILSAESHVIHIAIHSTGGEETPGVEKICWWLWRGWWQRTERSGGKVVWKSSEKLGQEAEENRTAGWAREGNYHSELQYKMCDDTKVSTVVFEIVTTI